LILDLGDLDEPSSGSSVHERLLRSPAEGITMHN
jgi:hypothetical protein